MSKKKEIMSVIFKILVIISSFTGLYLNLKMTSLTNLIVYFTTLSNIAIFIFYVVALLLYLTKKLKKNRTYYIFKGLVTICITLTMVVFTCISGTLLDLYSSNMVACTFVHIITPLMVIFDYIIYGEKGNLDYKFPILWSVALLVYTAFCYIYGFLGGTFANGDKYPYFYMDIEKNGITKALISCVVIYVAFVAYGYLIVFLDNLVAKKKKGE